MQYRYDVGGQHPSNCCDVPFTEDVAPQHQLHFRFTKAAVSFSPWIMNEGFRLLDIFMPDTFEPRGTIRIQSGFRRVSRSLLLGFYFDDDTPLLIWNRNTDLPNRFGTTDPIVWWKHYELKKEIKPSCFFKYND